MVASAPASDCSNATSRSSYSSSLISAATNALAIVDPVRCSPLFSLASQPLRSPGDSLSRALAAAGATGVGAGVDVAADIGDAAGRRGDATGCGAVEAVEDDAAAGTSVSRLPNSSSPTSAFSQPKALRWRSPAGS